MLEEFKIYDGEWHRVTRVRIWIYSGPYSVWLWENTDKNNSEYSGFLRSVNSIKPND